MVKFVGVVRGLDVRDTLRHQIKYFGFEIHSRENFSELGV